MARQEMGYTAGDLEQMNDTDLAALEDELLLEQELDTSKNARFSAARAVVWLLMIIGIVIMLGLFSRLPTSKLGPLNIPLYLIALGGGAALGHFAWKAVGQTIRSLIRLALEYWPILLYVGAQLFAFGKK